jgi:hypothetical protein
MTIISYLVHPEDKSLSNAPKNVISLDIKDPKDHTKDELYINFYNINRANWKYITPRYHFEYNQNAHFHQPEDLSGCIELSKTYDRGSGKMKFGNTEQSVVLTAAPSEYILDRAPGEECGAYVQDDGKILRWDTESDEWKNATFVKNELYYSYWFDDETDVHVLFKCMYYGAEREWEPQNFFLTPTINEEGIILFTFASPMPPYPPQDYFPYKMTYELDLLGQNVLGGATLNNSNSIYGDVYGIKGKTLNPPHSVGLYLLSKDGIDVGTLMICVNNLIINGKRGKDPNVSGNKIVWKGSDQQDFLDKDGFAEFSDNGDQIKSSSLGFAGTRYYFN